MQRSSVLPLLLAAFLSASTWAQTPSSPPEPAAAPAPSFEWKPGPSVVDLGHELTLNLPEGHVFLDKAQAAKLLELNGSFYSDNLLGLVSGADDDRWFVVIRYDQEGFIKDDEKLDSDDILGSIKEGQEEANKMRVEKSFEPLTIDGWMEPPHYDKSVHHLVWALTVGAKSGGKSVNYSTRILGRRGYVSLNLVTAPAQLEVDKPEVAKLLEGTTFKPGARYEDFDSKTDQVAEYGLTGLVLGGAGLGAAKLVKLGLLAKGWKLLLALLIAGKKLLVVAVLGLGALLKRIFGGKRESAEPDA